MIVLKNSPLVCVHGVRQVLWCEMFSLFIGQIKLQESPEDMPAGQTPHTTVVYAHNDLVDKVQPGDRINITGAV